MASAILGLRLVEFEYRDFPGLAKGPQLGFILDENPGLPFASSDKKRVNLYGYISAVVATIHKQQSEIAALRSELEQVKENLKR